MIPTSERETSIQIIGFNTGGRLFGADLLTIREILRRPSIEQIENVPDYVEGRIRIRGEIIPVISLKKRLGCHDSNAPAEEKHILIANVGERPLAFLVDSVTRIIRISEDDVFPAPDIIQSGRKNQYIRGVCNSQWGTLVVLELSHIFVKDEIEKFKRSVVPHIV